MSYGLRVVAQKPAVGSSVTLQLFANKNVMELRKRQWRCMHLEKAKMAEVEELGGYTLTQLGVTVD